MNKILIHLASASLAICLFLAQSNLITYAHAPQQEEDWVAQITQIDTSQFPQVMVYVSITGANGEPVEVNPANLIIKENGVEIEPQAISGIGDTDQPLTTMLVIDISGSMNSVGKLKAAKEAARAYVKQTRPNDQTGLLAFNTQMNYLQPITSDQEKLIKAINSLTADKDTALYDALLQAITIMEGTSGRKAIIALTDGMDNRSKNSPQYVIQQIGPAGLSISTIGLGDPQYSYGVLAGLDEAALTSLAESAGGVYGYANDASALTDLYERYGRALQSEYAISYLSPSTLRDGVNRSLTVSLKKGGSVATEGEKTLYNPGGLVPEVPQPAPWGIFLGLLAVLVILLVIPAILQRLLARQKKTQSGRIKLSKAAPRIRLKD